MAMQRMKKEPSWLGHEANVQNSGGDDAGTPAKKAKGGAKKAAAPRKRAPAKPKAKAGAKLKNGDEDDEENGDLMDQDDDEDAVGSPSMLPVTPRKGANNKVHFSCPDSETFEHDTDTKQVIGARVTKSGGGRKAKASKTPVYVETPSDFEMDNDSDHSSYHLEGGDEAPRQSKARSNGNGSVADGNGRNNSVSNNEQAEEEYDGPEDEEYAY